MFIKAVGPGAYAGVLAVSIHSIGMLESYSQKRLKTLIVDQMKRLSQPVVQRSMG